AWPPAGINPPIRRDSGSPSPQTGGSPRKMSTFEGPLVAAVDDDESMREATQSLLLSAGFRAAVFASAEDFLQAPQRQDTACLIVDVRMPGMSGLDLQQQLARRRSAIALIFITSHEDDEAR